MFQCLQYVTSGTRELFREVTGVVSVWSAYNKRQDMKRALAHMSRRFDLNDTFHDEGRTVAHIGHRYIFLQFTFATPIFIAEIRVVRFQN